MPPPVAQLVWRGGSPRKLKSLQDDMDPLGASGGSPKRRFMSPGKVRKETLLKEQITALETNLEWNIEEATKREKFELLSNL